MIKLALVNVIEKIVELFSKKTKSQERQQEIEMKKIDIFSKTIILIFVGVFFMCVLASVFPKLAVTTWWFDVFDRIINYFLTN